MGLLVSLQHLFLHAVLGSSILTNLPPVQLKVKQCRHPALLRDHCSGSTANCSDKRSQAVTTQPLFGAPEAAAAHGRSALLGEICGVDQHRCPQIAANRLVQSRRFLSS